MEDPLVREMIKDVDKSEVIKGRYIESPILGAITPKELSGGVKTLILLLFQPEYIYYGTPSGDNCAKWILETAKHHDIRVDFRNIMEFPEPFEIFIVNSGEIVTNMSDLISAEDKYLRVEVPDDWFL